MFSFYIEFKDGTAKIQTGLTMIGAKRKFNAFGRSIANNETVDCFGWEKTNPYSLHQQIRAKQAA